MKDKMNPYQVTKDLEQGLSEYTGAPYVVCVNSCTAALMLSCEFNKPKSLQEWCDLRVIVPSHTYCSVPMAVKHTGLNLKFVDYGWRGYYQLSPLPVYDCARRFTSGMYSAGQFQCVSFATTKILGIEQGGAILHDNPQADTWFRKMRFDGRTEGVDPSEDTFDVVGHHCIMLPSIAAQLLLKLHHLPKHNEDLPDYPYPDLSKHPAFK